MAGMPRRARHAMAAPSAQKSFLPEASSCAIMPAAAIIARRPLLSSLVCIFVNSLGSLGLRPRGSNPRSPGMWSVFIAHVSPLAESWKVKTENTSGMAIAATTAGQKVSSGVCWKAKYDGTSMSPPKRG